MDRRGNNPEKGMRKYSQLVGFPRGLHTSKRDVLTRVCMRDLPGLTMRRRGGKGVAIRRGEVAARNVRLTIGRGQDENRP